MHSFPRVGELRRGGRGRGKRNYKLTSYALPKEIKGTQTFLKVRKPRGPQDNALCARSCQRQEKEDLRHSVARQV